MQYTLGGRPQILPAGSRYSTLKAGPVAMPAPREPGMVEYSAQLATMAPQRPPLVSPSALSHERRMAALASTGQGGPSGVPAIPGAINVPVLRGDEIVGIGTIGPLVAQTTTAAIAALGGGGGGGGGLVPAVSKNTSYAVQAMDVGTYFDNGGAAGTVIFSLPHPFPGLNYRFTVLVPQILEVAVLGGDSLALGTANGSNVSSAFPFSSISVYAPAGTSGVWVVTNQTGGWSVA